MCASEGELSYPVLGGMAENAEEGVPGEALNRESKNRGGDERGPPNEAAPAAAPGAEEDESPEFNLGDTVLILGGRLDKTHGRIYYFGDELIQILPDGASDRLIDIELVDGDLNPELEIDQFLLVDKRTQASFVAQIDARVGYMAQTFKANGEEHTTFTIKEVNREEDSIILTDSNGSNHEVLFGFVGVPRDEEFAVIRVRAPDSEEGDDEAALVEGAEEEDDLDVEFLAAIEPPKPVPAFVGLKEVSAAERTYPDNLQRDDMFRDELSALPIPSQKNAKNQRVIRKFVEQLMMLRNEVVRYNKYNEPVGSAPTSFMTVAELLEKADVPLMRPLVQAARSIYMQHSLLHKQALTGDPSGSLDPKSIPGRDIDLNYIDDVVPAEIEFMNSMLGTAPDPALGGPVRADQLPAWFTTWETYFNRFFTTFKTKPALVMGGQRKLRMDKEFLRAPMPDGRRELVDGLQMGGNLDVVGAGQDAIIPAIGKIKVSLLRGLGSRSTRLGIKEPERRIETGDDIIIDTQLLFPLSSERELGSTRTGRISKDIALSHTGFKTMQQILEELGGVQPEPTAGGILAVGLNGNAGATLAIHDWLKNIPLLRGGLGDMMIDLKNLGLGTNELTQDQQDTLVEKIKEFRAKTNQRITQLRETAQKELAGLRLENRTFLQGEALDQFLAVIMTEPILAKRADEIRRTVPAYKDNDIGLFAEIGKGMLDLLMTALAQIPGPLAKERNRRVRDQFLDDVRASMLRAERKELKGLVPQPIDCPHVGDLDLIRAEKDETARMKLLAKLLTRFRGVRKDNWIYCANSPPDNPHKLMCYHEFLMLEEFHHPREKEMLHKELLLAFSGGQFQGQFMCKNCGQPISEVGYDTGMEFDEEGRPMASAAVVAGPKEVAQEDLERGIELMVQGVEDEKAAEEVTFATEIQTLIYKTARQIFDRVGIYAEDASYQRIVQRVEVEIQRQPSRADYAKLQAARVKAKQPAGIEYDILINRILVAATGAHCLIEVQTHVPGYSMRYRLPGCTAGFSGFPIGAEKDMTGVNYIACAIAGIRETTAPWGLTGFQREKDEKKRQEAIAAAIGKMAGDAMKTASVQQSIIDKKAYLEKLFGAGGDLGLGASGVSEMIPGGFRPVPYALSPEEAAAAPVVAEGAEPREIIRAWIQASHRLAKENGTYVKGSPLSDAACCFTPIENPKGFWTGKGGVLPALPSKQPPEGQHDSYAAVSFTPRKVAKLNPEVPDDLLYRVFLKVCYDGPRKGLPHEPGYTNECAHCGFRFADNPFIPTPAPPVTTNKEEIKEWQEEVGAIVTRGKAALETQRVAVTKETFAGVLDASHEKFTVKKYEVPASTTGLALLQMFQEKLGDAFEGWGEVLADTVTRVAALPPGSGEVEVATAYGPMSDLYQASIAEIQRRIGAQRTEALRNLLNQSPQQISESLRAYFLIPFQRLLTGFKTESLKISDEYKLGEGVVDDLEMILGAHLDYMPNLKKRVAGIAVAKLTKARDVLLRMLPILRNALRSMYVPGGGDAINYLIGDFFSVLLSYFIK